MFKQANFLIPEEILTAFRHEVPHGEQSKVVSHALELEIRRRQFARALQESFGAWKNRKDLGSTRSFVRKLRHERHF